MYRAARPGTSEKRCAAGAAHPHHLVGGPAVVRGEHRADRGQLVVEAIVVVRQCLRVPGLEGDVQVFGFRPAGGGVDEPCHVVDPGGRAERPAAAMATWPVPVAPSAPNYQAPDRPRRRARRPAAPLVVIAMEGQRESKVVEVAWCRVLKGARLGQSLARHSV